MRIEGQTREKETGEFEPIINARATTEIKSITPQIEKEEPKTFKLLVDYGKPFEETYQDKELLFKRLLELEQMSENEEFTYMDIIILNNLDKEITDKIMLEYNFKKEKVGF